MRRLYSLPFFLLFIAFQIKAQDARKFQLHSHNDYLQTVPFWTAFSAGASSIEVDVILKDGKLMAAHEPETIDPKRTIESLYLDPISEGLKSGVIPSINFHLLVDLKTAAYLTLEVLLESMKNYVDVLGGDDSSSGLKLVMSGNGAKPEEYQY